MYQAEFHIFASQTWTDLFWTEKRCCVLRPRLHRVFGALKFDMATLSMHFEVGWVTSDRFHWIWMEPI